MSPIGSAAAAVSVGALVWVFFVQAPWLTRKLGRDRFVPLMMTLVTPLLALTTTASVVLVATARGHLQLALGGGALVASALAIPVSRRALRAGGQSLREELSPAEQASAGRFLADGGGAATRGWHRALGLLLLTIGGTHAAWALLPADAHEHPATIDAVAQPGAEARRHRATPETVETVGAFDRAVREARATKASRGEEVAPRLQRDFATIFQRCQMTGEAHEALHAFLTPIAAELKTLAVAQTAEGTDASLGRLTTLLDQWPARFE
jgi:hypothetical protein